MKIPKLKRINVHSEQELDVWLTRNSSKEECVMVVTHANAAHRNFVSREQIALVLAKYGWQAESRYTLGSDLLGHVIIKLELQI